MPISVRIMHHFTLSAAMVKGNRHAKFIDLSDGLITRCSSHSCDGHGSVQGDRCLSLNRPEQPDPTSRLTSFWKADEANQLSFAAGFAL